VAKWIRGGGGGGAGTVVYMSAAAADSALTRTAGSLSIC